MGSSTLNDSFDSESDDQHSPTGVSLSASFSSTSSSKHGGSGSGSAGSSSSAAAAARAKKLAKADRKKRKQVKKACFACRKAHARCDDQRPCRRCVRMGHQATCVDIPRKKRVIRKNKDGFDEEEEEEIDENEDETNTEEAASSTPSTSATGKRPRRTKKARVAANNPFHSPDEGSDSCESGPDDCTHAHHRHHERPRRESRKAAAAVDGDDDYKPKRNQIQQRLRARRQRRDVEDSEEEALAASRPVVTDSSSSDRDDTAAENFFFNKQNGEYHHRAKRVPRGRPSSSSWQESVIDSGAGGLDGSDEAGQIDFDSDVMRGGEIQSEDEYGVNSPYGNDPTARQMMKELEELRSYNSGLQEMIRDVQEFNAYQRNKRSEWNNKLSSFDSSKITTGGVPSPAMGQLPGGAGGPRSTPTPPMHQNPGMIPVNNPLAVDNNLRMRISNKFSTTAQTPNASSSVPTLSAPPGASVTAQVQQQTPPLPQGSIRSALTSRRDPTLMQGSYTTTSTTTNANGSPDGFTFVQPAPRRPPA